MKPPIPGGVKTPFEKAVKENIEQIIGRRGTKIKPLNENASLNDVIAKINEVIKLLQGDG